LQGIHQCDGDERAIEAEHAGTHERAVGREHHRGQRAYGRSQHYRQAEQAGVVEDPDQEKQPGPAVVLQHHLPDAAKHGVQKSQQALERCIARDDETGCSHLHG
jgi:hypothetical protein